MKRIWIALRLMILGLRIKRLTAKIEKIYRKTGDMSNPKGVRLNNKLTGLLIKFQILQDKYMGE